MRSSKVVLWLRALALGATVLSIAAASGCGGSSSSKSTGGGTTPQVIAGPGPNVVTLTADSGPPSLLPNGYTNGAFVSATVCVPGTSTCQAIDHVLVDTGSYGLRLLDSTNGGELNRATVPLPQEKDASSNPIGECVQFVDGSFLWGPVVTADVKMSSEIASSVPVHLVGDSNFANVPNSCSTGGIDRNSLAALGSNGILGVGASQQDCPVACVPGTGPPPSPFYYTCPSGTCTPSFATLAQQVQNPVALFATDNNGVIVELPTVPAAGAPSATGALVFGIGTQTNNALGSASVLTLDDHLNLTAIYKGVSYPGSFIDSGSNAFYFLDSGTTGLAACSSNANFYCPSSTQDFMATNQGVNGTTTSISFSVANLDSFSASNWVFNDLGGPGSGNFDWGLPFFLGRNVFVSITGKTAPGGTPPYVAY